MRFNGKAAVGFQRESDVQGCFASTWCRESWYLSKDAVEISFPWQVIHNWGMPRNDCWLCQAEGIGRNGRTAGRRRNPGSRRSGRAEQHPQGTPVVGKVSNPHTGVGRETIL